MTNITTPYDKGNNFPDDPKNSPQWRREIEPQMYYDELEIDGDDFQDYHAVITIQLCELMNAGFDLLYDYNKDDEDKKRIVELAIRRNWFREIGSAPWKFKQNFNSILAEEVLKLKPLYDLLDDLKKSDIRDAGNSESKQRSIRSEYPQSQIKSSGQDYASNADDSENISQDKLGTLETYERYSELLEKYNDLDIRVVDELDKCFTSLMTSFVNL